MKVKLIAYTPDPERVVALAARMCYSKAMDVDTLESELDSAQIKRLIYQLKDSGHACYDDQTEVLTSTGFKFWKDITEEDKLAIINPQTAAFQGFEKPTQLHVYPVQDQNMLLLENDKYNFCVTDNHTLYMSLSYSQKQRAYPLFKLQKANDIIRYCTQKRGPLKPAWQFPMRMLRCACNRNETITDRDCEYKLYGFFIGDGHCTSGNTLSFHLRKPRKITYLRQICQECGYILDTLANDRYVVRSKNIANDYRSMFYDSDGNKTFPDSFYHMSYIQFQNFFDGLNNSDGFVDRTEYDTTSSVLRDKLLVLFCINGLAATSKTGFLSQENAMWKDLYRIRYSTKYAMPHINDSRDPDSYIKLVKYTGTVYCATVSTGLLLTRRNGKTLVSGNSTWEHVSFTFAIEGISRVVSHELVRHRIGCSYSQRSQRYCAEGECDFIEPNTISKKQDEAPDDIFWASVCNAKDDYKDLLEEGIPKEDARYVLPNATATRMIVTMNARALLHFFNLRCCNRALKEIRDLANTMLELVKDIAPTLFNDAGASCVSLGYCPEGKMCCGKAPTLQKLKQSYKDSLSK